MSANVEIVKKYIDGFRGSNNTVAIQGYGRIKQRDGDWLPCVFSEFFVFTNGKVKKLDTYHIFLSAVAG